MALYRVPKQRHSAKYIFAECQKKALGKDVFCRVPKNSTRQNTSLPSARKSHSAKTHFAVCRKIALGKIHLCRVPEKSTWQRRILSSVFFLPSVFYLALGIAECPIKYTRQSFRHSAKCRFPVVVGNIIC